MTIFIVTLLFGMLFTMLICV